MDKRVDYLLKLNNDLIAQFKRQPNTQALMSAVAKQLQSLHEAMEQLSVMRWLSTAEGKQLDGIGDIVVMTRADAARLEIGKAAAKEIDDATYRKYLRYKLFLNTSTGTRKEIMKALRFFWDEAPMSYSENPLFPATIFVDTPELTPDVPIEGLLEAPIVKPAGVRFIVRIHTKTQNDEYKIRHVGLSVVKNTKTEVPEAEHRADVAVFKLRAIGLSTIKVTRTEVAEIEQQVIIGKFDLRTLGLSVIKKTKTEVAEIEQERPVGRFGMRYVSSATVKRTDTQVAEVEPEVVSKKLRTVYSPQWSITRADTGEYTAAAVNTQRYKGLSTVKITNTPLAAYGGE